MDDVSIEAALAEIRRRRRQIWALWLGYIPAMVLLAIPIRLLVPVHSQETALMIAALAWMALFAGATVRVGWVRCPRCGERFHERRKWGIGLWHNPWSRRCLNCHLPLRPCNRPYLDSSAKTLIATDEK